MTNQLSSTLELAKQLIACPSITPLDANCQIILAHRLQKLGFTIQHLRYEEVQNLWAVSGNQAPLLVFAGHTDVVPPGNLSQWETDPFHPTVKGEYLVGRGAADMKGSLAAMVTAVERFTQKQANFNGSIGFLITSDEEGVAINGTQKVMEYLTRTGIHIHYCIVGEPSSQNRVGDVLKNGRRGSLNCHLKIFGKQGHIAHPKRADNPIHRALLPLLTLINTRWDEGNEHFPATSLQISNIKAGTGAVNIIPDSLECQFNFRFNTETTPELLLARIHEVLTSQNLHYELTSQVSGFPFLTSAGFLVAACSKAIIEITGVAPVLSTDGGTSDGRFIAPTGAEVIELGPCNATIHSTNESIKIVDLELLSTIYEKILQEILLPITPHL